MSYYWYIIISQAVVIVSLVVSMLVYDCPECRRHEEKRWADFAKPDCVCPACKNIHSKKE